MVVIAKSAKENTIIVGEECDALKQEFWARKTNWIRWEIPPAIFRAKVRTRYHGQEADASIETFPEGKARIVFDTQQHALAPGQAAVFYEGDIVLGGGILQEGQHDN
jgi:tRNA-specific 2-thiouridylase